MDRGEGGHEEPGPRPLLIIEGEKDHTVPWAIAEAAYKRQKRNPGVTEIVKIPNRGHSLTIDHGWREVAETALDVRQEVCLAARARCTTRSTGVAHRGATCWSDGHTRDRIDGRGGVAQW